MIPTVPVDLVKRSLGTRNQVVVSVVTAAFNPGPDFRDTAVSIAAQSFQSLEWIIVDDASSHDGAAEIDRAIEGFGLPFTVLRHRENFKQGQARNTGISRATGTWIKFIDADDVIDPNHLERLARVADNFYGSRTLVFAPTRHVYTRTGMSTENHSYVGSASTVEGQLVRMLTHPFLHHCGALFPKSLLLQLGGYDPHLVTDEDGDLLLRVLLAGWRFEAVPGTVYGYHHHSRPGRVSRNDTVEKIIARRDVGRRVLEHYERLGLQVPSAVKRAVCARLDALAVASWDANRVISKELLREARALQPGHPWSGSRTERSIRLAFGIGCARRIISTARTVRGYAFGRQ